MEAPEVKIPKGSEIMERKSLPEGKTFIRAGEEHARAYIIQSGSVKATTMVGENEIEIGTYGPGRIIGELFLMSNEPMDISYTAVEKTTVITLSRDDFQKKIIKMDKTVATILDFVMNKLNYQYIETKQNLSNNFVVTPDAQRFIEVLMVKVPPEKRPTVEARITQHVVEILNTINAV